MEIKVGKKLFQFENFNQWVNKASSWYGMTGLPRHRYISLDSVGNICVSGKEFMWARDNGAFPVSVYDIESAPQKMKGTILHPPTPGRAKRLPPHRPCLKVVGKRALK